MRAFLKFKVFFSQLQESVCSCPWDFFCIKCIIWLINICPYMNLNEAPKLNELQKYTFFNVPNNNSSLICSAELFAKLTYFMPRHVFDLFNSTSYFMAWHSRHFNLSLVCFVIFDRIYSAGCITLFSKTRMFRKC